MALVSMTTLSGERGERECRSVGIWYDRSVAQVPQKETINLNDGDKTALISE